MIDLSHVLPLLPHDKSRESLTLAVSLLENGVASGMVRNADFVACKDTINRRIEAIVDTYNEKHGYRFDPIVSNAHSVAAGLKAAKKIGDAGRVQMFTALLPVKHLIETCKPLIVKKQDQGPTEKQIAAAAARAGHEMTCQCCFRGIFAERGSISHHGYQRPGEGWQTASCMGAMHLPFEVSRDRLGYLINLLVAQERRLMVGRESIADETCAISYERHNMNAKRERGLEYPLVVLEFTRENFDAVVDANTGPGLLFTSYEAHVTKGRGFDDVKAKDLASRDALIHVVKMDLAECKKRYVGWKQTHKWEGSKWIKLEEAA